MQNNDPPSSEIADFYGIVLSGGLTLFIYYIAGAVHIVSGNMLYERYLSPAQRQNFTQQAAHSVWIGFCLPILVNGAVHLLTRRRFPIFARGVGIVCVVATAIALGAPFICSSSNP